MQHVLHELIQITQRLRLLGLKRPPASGADVALLQGMDKLVDSPTENGQRLLLASHHVAIETACADLRACMYGNDPLELIVRYRAFERAIASHLTLEEQFILPAYADYDPEDARAIRKQHDELLRLLNRVAIDAELHCVRAWTLEQLLQRLRRHAEHEDAKMYPWAQQHLELPAKRHLFDQVTRSLRALARARAAFARVDAPPSAVHATL